MPNHEEPNVKDCEHPVPPACLDFAEIPDSKRNVPEDDGSQARVVERLELPIVGDAVHDELSEPEYDGRQTNRDHSASDHVASSPQGATVYHVSQAHFYAYTGSCAMALTTSATVRNVE